MSAETLSTHNSPEVTNTRKLLTGLAAFIGGAYLAINPYWWPIRVAGIGAAVWGLRTATS